MPLIKMVGFGNSQLNDNFVNYVRNSSLRLDFFSMHGIRQFSKL